MPGGKKTAAKRPARNSGANIGYEAQLWQMADALRGSMDAAEYKRVVLGLISPKHISDAFEEHDARLPREANPQDPDEHGAVNAFRVPGPRAVTGGKCTCSFVGLLQSLCHCW